MPSLTDTFRECQRLRRHIRDLQAEIDRGPRVLQGREEELEEARQAHAAHHESITRLKLKQREDELSLKQTEARLTKLREQLTGISVPKEYAAKESEIAQALAKQSELEDAILTTIAVIEEKTTTIPVVEQTWLTAQNEFAGFKKEAATRLERLKADQVASLKALTKAENELPETVRPKYDSLVKAHGPEAMAAVKAKVCMGCRTSLTEQKWAEVRGGALFMCPNCGKFLYPAE